jgi:hypothetical protein
LVVSYAHRTLSAANTGAPLDRSAVQALATLRASGKRSGRTVGRFGVGFAAVAAVADEVVVASTTGAVRFSRQASYDAVAALPQLAGELAARDGRVPLLRLPFASGERPPAGFATQVRVLVRPDADAAVRAMLADVDPALLLVLPGLAVLTLPDRELRREVDRDDVLLGGRRYRVATATGELDAALLAGRPVEERAQTTWSVTWAVPVDDAGVPQPVPAGVFRAPTPTDDPLSTPAVLAASLPLGPDRRRVVPGPLAEAVLAHAAGVLADLLPRLADDPGRLRFVPGPLAAGELDAVLGGAVLQALRSAPFLAAGRRPADCVVLSGASDDLVDVLGDVLPGLLPAAWSSARWEAPLRALGVRRLDLAALTEVLSGLARPASWWRSLYAALPPDRDALGALPVPLAGGGLAPGPRGLLLADPVVDLSPLGVRLVHPDAAHPLLLRLGAVQAEPRTLLEDPRVRAAVEAAGDDVDALPLAEPVPVVDAVLALVGAAGVRPGELPWLAALPLPTDDGGRAPAGELLLPAGPLARVVDRDAGFGVVAPGLAPDDVLAAVGVLRGFAVTTADDADGVDGLDGWLATLPPGQEPGPVVRDLDLVRDDAWPQALDLLDSQGLLTSSYVRWWLAGAPVLDGRRPRALRVPGTDPLLVGLYDEAPGDAGRAALLGARTALAAVLLDEPEDVLERLADPARAIGREQLRAVHAALAGADVEPPAQVRAVVSGRLEVVPAEDAVVVDRPDLLARVAPYAVLPAPLALARQVADVLDVAPASELVPEARLPRDGAQPWAQQVGGLAPATGLVRVDPALRAPGAGGWDVGVDWVADGDVDHVRDVEGLARALAWRRGDWPRRHELLARLRGEWSPADADLDPA